jgi:uncharacterized glyoxalase superfamily protein PhnB
MVIRRSTDKFIGTMRDSICDWFESWFTVRTADQIKQLFDDYQSAGVRFHQTLKTEPWGSRTFIVIDSDGNLILFAAPVK